MCSDQGDGAKLLIKMIARSADAGPGGWVGLKRKLLHLDVDGSGATNAEGTYFLCYFQGHTVTCDESDAKALSTCQSLFCILRCTSSFSIDERLCHLDAAIMSAFKLSDAAIRCP